jgi:hypothetical protein
MYRAMTTPNDLDPGVIAESVQWDWFKANVLERHFNGWESGGAKPGRLCERDYPSAKFKFYRITDGAEEKQGTWAVAKGVLTLERHMPDSGSTLLFDHYPRKPTTKNDSR